MPAFRLVTTRPDSDLGLVILPTPRACAEYIADGMDVDVPASVQTLADCNSWLEASKSDCTIVQESATA